LNDFGLNTISEENHITNTMGGEASFCAKLALACGNSTNPIPPIMSESNGGRKLSGSAITPSYDPNGFNWLAQQNGGGFDPVLFGEYREPQNAVVSQDFGSFFNDAFPLPDLGSPLHNFNDVAPSPLPRPDPLNQAEAAQQGEKEEEEEKEKEEVVPGEDRGKLMSCNKIWFVRVRPLTVHRTYTRIRDRLQSMEKFRNGEIDVDNLCAELRSKARCSEGGAVVDEREVDRILGKAK
jgi:AP-1-like factor